MQGLRLMTLPTKTKFFRVLFLLLAIVLGIYRLAADYYELDPRFLRPTQHGLTALFYYELGQYGRASRAWRTDYEMSDEQDLVGPEEDSAAEAAPQSALGIDNPFEAADACFVDQDYAKAASIYRNIIQQHPASVDAKIGLASVLSILGEYAESQALWEEVLNRGVLERRVVTFLNFLTALDALEHSPTRAVTTERWLTVAYAYRYLAIYDKRKLAKVVSAADQALALNPTVPGAFVSKGVVSAKEGDYARAFTAFARAVELRPTADTYRRLAAAAGAIGRLKEEVEAYMEAVRLEPNRAQYAYQLGEVLLRKYGDLQRASDYLRQAYDLDPQHRSAALMYAYSLERLPRHEDALNVYDEIARRWPEDQEGMTLKAACLISLKRYREAIDLFLAAQRMGPLSFEALQDLGFAYAQAGDPDHAIAAYQRASRLKPHDIHTLYILQGLYRQQGRHQEAYNTVRAILRIDPNHSGAQRLLPYVERNRPR